MSVDLVLNELSLATPAETDEHGIALMSGLAETMFEAGRWGANKVLRAPRNFHAMMLGPSYPVGRWPRDKRVSMDDRTRFLVWTTKSPYLNRLLEDAADDSFARSEFHYSGRRCEGLAIAKIVGGLGVSFQSADEWNVPVIALKAFELVEDGNESLEYDCEVNHAATVAHVRRHAGWIGRRRMQAVADGKDCCARFSELFPRIYLCDHARKQLSALGKGEELFQTAYEGLEELSRYASDWRQGGFREDSLVPCSQESNSTLEQFGDERTFVCPDGQRRTFSWHLKRGRWRTHFIPDEASRTILVGYLGKHLRTAKYR
jgi:hypothetical protein